MTEIPATLVKALRDRTGAGIMACRTTLAETAGDFDAAIERLRDAQTSMAARKADRVAVEGLVALAVAGERGAIVEVNCETDFVARGEDFRRAVSQLAPAALAAKAGGQETGLLIVGVDAGSPADKGGVLIGDILVAMDGSKVEDTDDLQALLGPESVGKPAALTVLRGGEPASVAVTVGERS